MCNMCGNGVSEPNESTPCTVCTKAPCECKVPAKAAPETPTEPAEEVVEPMAEEELPKVEEPVAEESVDEEPVDEKPATETPETAPKEPVM